ncbi:MAG: alanine:cation symporter family protein, partial [Gammaproteobacteria bacterium]|nr:alanine:cation symporter family protein [Gammaproteobacteria bacterium]
LISHESGLGISSIAHASAKTDYPVRQGLIAMLEPFIDTILICFLTALVLLMAMDNGFLPIGYASLNVKLAFEYFIPWFGPLFNFIMILMTLSCLVSCYFYVGKLIQYIFNCKLSIYTLTGYCLIMYFGMKLALVDLLPITILLMPLVILPNLVCILIYAKEIKKDLVVFLTNLDDSFIN